MNALTRRWLMRFCLTVLFLIVLIALISGSIYWLHKGRYYQSTDNAYIHGDNVAIRAELNARVIAVNVAHNQKVKQGELLVELDPSDFLNNLHQAEAQSDQAQAQVIQAEKNVEAARAQIDEYQAQLTARQAQNQQARQQFRRATQLAAKKVISQQDFDNRQADEKVSAANSQAAQAQIVSAKHQLAVQQAALKVAQAATEAAKAQIAIAETQLSRTQIKAPADGIVGNISIEVGSYAQPALTLMQLVPIDRLYVEANFKETQIERVRIGQPVKIHIDAYPNIRFEGIVESLAPATGTEFSLLPVDNATGNFNKIVQRVPVKIRLTGPVKQLKYLQAGLSVEPTIDTRRLEGNAIYVTPQPNLNLPEDQVPTNSPVSGKNGK